MNYDGSIIIKAEVDSRKAEKDLNALNKKVDTSAKEMSGTKTIRFNADVSDVYKEMQKVQNKIASLEGKRLLAESQLSGVNVEKDALRERIRTATMLRQNELAMQLTKEWDALNRKAQGYEKTIADTNTKIDIQKDKFAQISASTVDFKENIKKSKDAFSKMDKSVNRFALRLREVARSALLFTVITQTLASFRKWLGRVIEANDETRAAVSKLKGALLTMAQPILEVVVPALTTLVNMLTKVAYAAASVIAALFGTTVKNASESAEELYKEIEALEGIGAAAKKASKSLAGFDEINRLTGDTASEAANAIKPDFSAASPGNLAGWLKDLVFDLEAKIRELRFSWDSGTIMNSKDAWIVALTGILGAVLGGVFGGVNGSIIGLLLGLSVGLISCTFLDKLENPDLAKDLFIVAIGSILGTVLGGMFGGITGAVIGLLLGASISLVSIEFAKGDTSDWDSENTIIVALSAILGAVLGAAFGGLAGGVIGLLLGCLISFVAIKFSGNDFNKSEAIASLRIALLTLLGLIFGAMFGGLFGSVIGVIVGLTIGFASVGFDKTLDSGVRQKAKSALGVAMTTIIGALVGAVFGGGVFGGIVGGVIGLTLGLAVTFGSATVKNKTGLSNSVSSYSSLPRTGTVPQLATGAVIPPNREFLAVLGDQNRGNNIETPEALLRKIVREEGGSHMSDVILRDILGAIRAGHVIAVDNVALGKVMQKTSYNTARASGTSLL